MFGTNKSVHGDDGGGDGDEARYTRRVKRNRISFKKEKLKKNRDEKTTFRFRMPTVKKRVPIKR